MVSTVHRVFSSMSKMVPKVVLVLGPPGSGKGLQCNKIISHYEYIHLSAGDLLREERSQPNSKYGKLIDSCIKDGRIVPVEITCNLLEQSMKKLGSNRFVIDGFPRNKDNLEGWNKNLAPNVSLQFMIFLECPMDICKERCLGRGAAGSGRSDDNLDSLNKRFVTYETETRPIIDYFEEKGLVKHIDATKAPDVVFEDIRKLFDAFIKS